MREPDPVRRGLFPFWCLMQEYFVSTFHPLYVVTSLSRVMLSLGDVPNQPLECPHAPRSVRPHFFL